MADLSTERLSYQNSLIALLESLNSTGTVTVDPLRLTLINLVKIKLDELVPEGEGVKYDLETEPNISDPLDLYINGLLDESATNLLQVAPKHLCPVSQSENVATANTDEKTGYVKVPDDYLRLYSFKMTEWEREVNDPITTDDPKYKMQSSLYVRGGVAKPILVITHKYISDAIYRIFEYYSVNSAHTIERFLYIPETAAEDLDDKLYPALTWICAGKILQNIKEIELSTKAFEQAKLCYINLK
jgi:hypothetical protein